MNLETNTAPQSGSDILLPARTQKTPPLMRKGDRLSFWHVLRDIVCLLFFQMATFVFMVVAMMVLFPRTSRIEHYDAVRYYEQIVVVFKISAVASAMIYTMIAGWGRQLEGVRMKRVLIDALIMTSLIASFIAVFFSPGDRAGDEVNIVICGANGVGSLIGLVLSFVVARSPRIDRAEAS